MSKPTANSQQPTAKMLKKIAVEATIGIATEVVKSTAEMLNDPNVQEVGAKMKAGLSAPREATKVKKEQKLQIEKVEALKLELGAYYLKRWFETEDIHEDGLHFVQDIANMMSSYLVKLKATIVSEQIGKESKSLLAELKKMDELSAKAKKDLGAFYWHLYDTTGVCEPAVDHQYKLIAQLMEGLKEEEPEEAS